MAKALEEGIFSPVLANSFETIRTYAVAGLRHINFIFTLDPYEIPPKRIERAKSPFKNKNIQMNKCANFLIPQENMTKCV